jgi:hypothetical protein
MKYLINKDMIDGKLGDGTISADLPFDLIVSTIRRKKFLSNYYFFSFIILIMKIY